MTRSTLLDGSTWVTDGGLETDLIFNRGIDLPEFASFPLVLDPDGAVVLADYYQEYADIAVRAGAALLLETPTWRANPDWGERLGFDATALERVNAAAVDLMRDIGRRSGTGFLVSGMVGPRGDGYVAGTADADQAEMYHAPQLTTFRDAGADLAHALTLNTAEEAIGVCRAARTVGLPVAVSFTVETDGRLPDGRSLQTAIAAVEADTPADWYGVNCAHPTHVAAALADLPPISIFRPNASTLTHAELDAMEVLDPGDIALLTAGLDALRPSLPGLRVIGGCCGTDARHVAALWGLPGPI